MLVISPDFTILTEDAFALTVRCVQTRHDLMLTLGAPSMDSSFRILQVLPLYSSATINV